MAERGKSSDVLMASAAYTRLVPQWRALDQQHPTRLKAFGYGVNEGMAIFPNSPHVIIRHELGRQREECGLSPDKVSFDRYVLENDSWRLVPEERSVSATIALANAMFEAAYADCQSNQ